jgi:hypothetical protein
MSHLLACVSLAFCLAACSGNSATTDGGGSDGVGPDGGGSTGSDGGRGDDGGTVADVGSPTGANPIPYMIGIKADERLDSATTMQSWLGRPIDIVGATITTTTFMFTDPTHPYAGTPTPVLNISFPLLSCWDNGDSGSYDDLGMAASGGYDTYYKAMADYLVSLQNPTAVVAIGWEMTGDWYCWSVGSSGGKNVTLANYIAAYKRAAQILRQEFKAAGKSTPLIEFCFAWGQPADPTTYWPGKYDATANPGGADVVSADAYQANVTQYNNNNMTSTWTMIQSSTGLASPVVYDMDWMATFAQQEDVLLGLREYGAGGPTSGGAGSGGPTCAAHMAPGVNDPSFYTDARNWLNGLGSRVAYNIVTDDAPADDFLTPACNAAEQASWTSYYANTVFGGSWWPH